MKDSNCTELICIDLEASGLSEESYPIEIAWKNDLTGESDSFLINPDSAEGWCYWDEHAEEIHGIERVELQTTGIDILSACQRLNKKLKGKTLISDAYQLDFFWLKRLFNACRLTPTFQLVGLDSVLSREEHIQFGFLAKTQWRLHRALQDVESTLQCIHAVRSTDV